MGKLFGRVRLNLLHPAPRYVACAQIESVFTGEPRELVLRRSFRISYTGQSGAQTALVREPKAY
jgi:hypothetical protein